MKQLSLLAALLFFVAAGCNPEREAPSPGEPETVQQPVTDVPTGDPTAGLYAVAEYDPARDPAADLQAAVQQARQQGKRILVEVGGEWCTWCHALDKYLREHPDVTARLRDNFLVLKVNYSEENENAAFLSQYPEIPGYPHMFVLDQDGTFLHSQGTAELEEGDSYSDAAFASFIEQWGPGQS